MGQRRIVLFEVANSKVVPQRVRKAAHTTKPGAKHRKRRKQAKGSKAVT
jgi:hypothetical protein